MYHYSMIEELPTAGGGGGGATDDIAPRSGAVQAIVLMSMLLGMLSAEYVAELFSMIGAS